MIADVGERGGDFVCVLFVVVLGVDIGWPVRVLLIVEAAMPGRSVN